MTVTCRHHFLRLQISVDWPYPFRCPWVDSGIVADGGLVGLAIRRCDDIDITVRVRNPDLAVLCVRVHVDVLAYVRRKVLCEPHLV